MTTVLVDKLVLLTADATTLSGDLAVRLPTFTNISVAAMVRIRPTPIRSCASILVSSRCLAGFVDANECDQMID
jgi:hypothetical protein